MKFKVNGQNVEVDVPENTPLLWVIREELELTGTKFGCGAALCGACTVHVDGQARRSCVTPAAEVAGKSVTTIEGLASADDLHAVQKAWLAENVPQCGFCQAGQIMTAVALLRAKGAEVTDADIDAVMSANLCRCGTYPAIRRAIARLVAAGGQESP